MTSKRFDTFLYNLGLFLHVVLSGVWDVITWETRTARCFVGAAYGKRKAFAASDI